MSPLNEGNAGEQDRSGAAKILAMVEDLIFTSKIQQAAKLAGVRVEFVQPQDVVQRVGEETVGALIVDLNHRSGRAMEVVRAVKSGPAAAATRTLGFVSHVQGDVIEAARAAGCDLILARSAFAEQLPELLRKLARPGAPVRDRL